MTFVLGITICYSQYESHELLLPPINSANPIAASALETPKGILINHFDNQIVFFDYENEEFEIIYEDESSSILQCLDMNSEVLLFASVEDSNKNRILINQLDLSSGNVQSIDSIQITSEFLYYNVNIKKIGDELHILLFYSPDVQSSIEIVYFSILSNQLTHKAINILPYRYSDMAQLEFYVTDDHILLFTTDITALLDRNLMPLDVMDLNETQQRYGRFLSNGIISSIEDDQIFKTLYFSLGSLDKLYNYDLSVENDSIILKNGAEITTFPQIEPFGSIRAAPNHFKNDSIELYGFSNGHLGVFNSTFVYAITNNELQLIYEQEGTFFLRFLFEKEDNIYIVGSEAMPYYLIFNSPKIIKLTPLISSVDVIEKQQIQVYPNPSQDHINVISSHLIESINIFDVHGRRVFFENNINQYDVYLLTNLYTGSYTLEVISDKGLYTKEKIIIH